MEFNLADIFESVADAVPDREALVFGDRRLTYAELERRANRLAHHFLDVGVQPGDHIGLQLYNCTEYVEAMIACFKVRAVPVNVNYRYVEDELAYLFNDADLVAVLVDTDSGLVVVTVALLVDQRTAIRPDWPCVVTIAAPLPAVNDLRGNDGARPQVSRALSDRGRGASFRPPRRRSVTVLGKGPVPPVLGSPARGDETGSAVRLHGR